MNSTVFKSRFNAAYYMATADNAKDFRVGKIAETYRRILRRIDVSGKVVLDIGCGRGELMSLCAETAKQVVGLDYSEHSIAVIAHYSKSSSGKVYNFHASLVEDIEERGVQAVFCIDTIQFLSIPEIEEMFAGLKKVCAAGCDVFIQWPVFCNPEWRVQDYTPKEIQDAAKGILKGQFFKSTDDKWSIQGVV